MSTDPGPSSRLHHGSDEEEGRNNNINIIHHEPTLPSQDAQDPELAPPRDETTQDEADLFSARRPIIVSPERIYSSLEYLTSLSLLGILSFFGTLFRLGLVALGTYDGQSIFPLLWAQMVGCCLMGMFTVRKRCIEEIYIPLYVGLTTGLCGSITSFSSWMGDVFQAFARIGKPSHGAFYNFMDGLGISLVTLAASSAAFVLGTQVGPVILHPRGLHFIARWVRLNRYGRFEARHRERVQMQGTTKRQGDHLENGSATTSIADGSTYNMSNGSARNEEQQLYNGDNGDARRTEANGSIPSQTQDGNTGNGNTAGTSAHGNGQGCPNGNTEDKTKEANNNQNTKPSDAGSILHTISVEDLQPNYPAWLQLQLCLLFTLMWLATILISIYIPKWRGIVSFSLIFSPIGVWLRFHLARFNLRYESFPLGTFLANQIGTAILAILIALQYTPVGRRNLVGCQIIQGIEDGFCGTLTTVSTFIVELKKLERKHAYRYALSSWIVGQLFMLVILGSVDFARGGGLEQSKCAIR